MTFPNQLLGPRIESAWVEVLAYPSGDVLGVANHIDVSTVEISRNIDSRIVGGLKLTWSPPTFSTPEFDWDRVMFRPWTRANTAQWPWGVYIASSVARKGTAREIQALDKTSLLDADAPTSTYTLQAGTNIVSAVLSIFADRLPYEKPNIPATDKTTDAMMTWPPGTPYLTIIDDLLGKAYYTNLRVDRYGVFFAKKYVDPYKRAVVHTFTSGELSIHEPYPTDTQDFLSVPNQVICTTQGTDTSPALLSVATNDLADSPYSVTKRGRIISKTYQNVEASDQATLDRIASRNLWNSSTPVRTLVIKHAKVPLDIDEVVEIEDDVSQLVRTLALVNEFTMKLTPGELVSGTWNVVSQEMGQLVSEVTETSTGAQTQVPVYTSTSDDGDSSSDDSVSLGGTV